YIIVSICEFADDPCFAAIHGLLPMNRHSPTGVVHHNRNDGQLMARHRFQFLQIKPEGAIAHQQDDAALWFGNLGTDSHAKPDAKKSEIAIADGSFRPRLMY